jgi:hypothetical protein
MRGRKRKSGPRFPGGRLKPTAEQAAARGPNPKVLAERRALLGRPDAKVRDLTRAENPLDCMAERGWIPEDLARFGRAYAELHRRAGLRQARTTLIADERSERSGVEARALSDMTPEEIAQVWEAAMARQASPGPGDGDPEAAAELKALWRALGFAACTELHAVCLMGSWPVWAMQKVCGRSDVEIAPKWLLRRTVLVRGLEVVREHLAPRRTCEPRDAWEPAAEPAVEETVVYVDETGAPDPVVNAAGVVVEVVRRRRGRALPAENGASLEIRVKPDSPP